MSVESYGRFALLEAVIGLALIWAVIGTFLYARVLTYFGLETIGFELRVALFLDLLLQI